MWCSFYLQGEKLGIETEKLEIETTFLVILGEKNISQAIFK